MSVNFAIASNINIAGLITHRCKNLPTFMVGSAHSVIVAILKLSYNAMKNTLNMGNSYLSVLSKGVLVINNPSPVRSSRRAISLAWGGRGLIGG